MPFNPLSWLTDSPAPPPAPAPPAQATIITAPAPPPPPPPPAPPVATPTTPSDSARLRKQLTVLLAGSAFLLLSITTTRRSLTRRRLLQTPSFYHTNTHPPRLPANSALDAVEALNLATLNTMAFAVLVVGGGMVAMDVCDLGELRERVRARTIPEGGREAEEEWEEWVVGVLARREMREEVKMRVKREWEREKEREGGGGREMDGGKGQG